MTPAERAARVERIAAELRDTQSQGGNPWAYAIGCIRAYARPGQTDAEVATGVRDVLAALEIVTKPADGAGR